MASSLLIIEMKVLLMFKHNKSLVIVVREEICSNIYPYFPENKGEKTVSVMVCEVE